MNLFFCGIGGIGMSSLARWCISEGHYVSGSEIKESSITSKLSRKSMDIFIPQQEENVSRYTDIFIYTEAIPENHPERKKAQELNIPQYSYFEYLGIMAEEKRLIAVAGTHGKTTTTGLVASGLIKSKIAPTVVIGAETALFENTNFHAGTSNWAVIEACEYRENFRFLKPEIVLLTNIEIDHVDYYKSEEQYFEAYRSFIKKAKKVICHPHDPNTEKVLEGFRGEIIYTKEKNLKLTLIGQHNQKNALLAESLGETLEAEKKLFMKGLFEFPGTSRRQEYLGIKKNVLVYDDYGHHPTEIMATYTAFQEAFPGKKIGLIFEPHQYSRTRELLEDFILTLKDISPLGILPIYEARDTEEDKQSLDTKTLAEKCGGEFLQTQNDISAFVNKNLPQEDILIFMGAGSVSTIAHEFLTNSLF